MAGEGVVDGAHGFRVMKIENIEWFRCANFSISDVVVSGMVHAWVGQKLLNCFIFKSFSLAVIAS